MLGVNDIIATGICILFARLIVSRLVRKKSLVQQKIVFNAFWFRILCSLVFAMITAYYYKGGDSEMFLYATRDISNAIAADDFSFSKLVTTEKVDYSSTLAYYFQQDNTKYPVYGFMGSASNFLVPKLGLIPYLIFFKSYLAMCIVFSLFAFAGAMQLFKLFHHYFPSLEKEIALATLFLPSACYWSSGLLKDSICFGSVGFLLYGLFNIFIRRKLRISSILWVLISVYFIYTTKVYILLALIPGIGFWILGEVSAGIKLASLRRGLAIFSLILAGIGAVYFIDYLTSDVALSKFSLDNLLESSDFSRGVYEKIEDGGSNFKITTTSPLLLMLNGLIATFFRPFPWEVNSLIVLFSALESLAFLSLIVYLFVKKGVLVSLKKIFKSPIFLLCFSFAIIFATSIGISTGNFGSLSRYKIPCLPFYLMFVLGGYHLTELPYPVWMKKILNFVSSDKKVRTNVRHRRVHQS